MVEKRGASARGGPGKRVGVPTGPWGQPSVPFASPHPPVHSFLCSVSASSGPERGLSPPAALPPHTASPLPLHSFLHLLLGQSPALVPPCSQHPSLAASPPPPHSGAVPAQPPTPPPHYSLGERTRHMRGDSCWGLNQSVHSFSCSCPLPGESWGMGTSLSVINRGAASNTPASRHVQT